MIVRRLLLSFLISTVDIEEVFILRFLSRFVEVLARMQRRRLRSDFSCHFLRFDESFFFLIIEECERLARYLNSRCGQNPGAALLRNEN